MSREKGVVGKWGRQYRLEACDKVREEPAWWAVGFRAAQGGWSVPSQEHEAEELGSKL